MTLRAPDPRHSAEAYLAQERVATFRSEYIDGEIGAMSGGSFAHSLVATNLSDVLTSRLADTPCGVLSSDMRVRVDADPYTHPDVAVVCDPPELEDSLGDTLLNPAVILEVLSPSTEAYDRGEKFRRYRRLSSLVHYVLVAQDAPRIEIYTRQGDLWTFREASGLAATLVLDALGCWLPLADGYAKVALPTSVPGAASC